MRAAPPRHAGGTPRFPKRAGTSAAWPQRTLILDSPWRVLAVRRLAWSCSLPRCCASGLFWAGHARKKKLIHASRSYKRHANGLAWTSTSGPWIAALVGAVVTNTSFARLDGEPVLASWWGATSHQHQHGRRQGRHAVGRHGGAAGALPAAWQQHRLHVALGV